MNISIEINPGIPFIVKDVEREIETIESQIMKRIADDTPDDIRAVMDESTPAGRIYPDGHQASAEGQAPAKKSGSLYRSIVGRVLSATRAVIEFAGHIFFLDPLYKGQGGGYLNRPSIERGITKTMQKL